MRIFAITPAGFAALTVLVLALWGCFAGEKITTNRADRVLRASLRQIERLRIQSPAGHEPQPVSHPIPGPALRNASAA